MSYHAHRKPSTIPVPGARRHSRFYRDDVEWASVRYWSLEPGGLSVECVR